MPHAPATRCREAHLVGRGTAGAGYRSGKPDLPAGADRTAGQAPDAGLSAHHLVAGARRLAGDPDSG